MTPPHSARALLILQQVGVELDCGAGSPQLVWTWVPAPCRRNVGHPVRGSLALVITVRRTALPREAMAGSWAPERMHFGGLCVTAAGGTVPETGKGWPDFHTLGCDRAFDGLPELL